MRYWLKECPRCGGDLHEEWDLYGRFIACLQCGYILSESQETRLPTPGLTARAAFPLALPSGCFWKGRKRAGATSGSSCEPVAQR